MSGLFRAFVALCLLRIGPQELPASRFLLALTLAVYAATSFALASLLVPMDRAISLVMVDIALLGGLTALVLWIRNYMARFVQTLTALSGAGAVFGLVSFPPLLWQARLDTGPSVPTLPGLLLLAVSVWSIVVIGHVLRHALSTVLGAGVLLAGVYSYISWQVMRILFGTLG